MSTTASSVAVQIPLGTDAVGQRLDAALVVGLASLGHAYSRSQLARVFAEGLVRVDGQRCKPSRVVESPVVVDVVVPVLAPVEAFAENLPLHVVYEDDALLVIDKPAGMVVHAGPGHSDGTLVNAVLHYLGVSAADLPVLPGNAAIRPGIVHRLDRDTSGLIVVARTARAQEGLAVQFREHSLKRSYLGVVWGVPEWQRRSLRTRHGRDPGDRRRFSPHVDEGREAVTHLEVVRTLGQVGALLRFRLETGRTHQIRMHCRLLGYPIAGDALYGGIGGPPVRRAIAASLGRHALHAEVLGFRHPLTHEQLEFSSALPPALAQLVEQLAG